MRYDACGHEIDLMGDDYEERTVYDLLFNCPICLQMFDRTQRVFNWRRELDELFSEIQQRLDDERLKVATSLWALRMKKKYDLQPLLEREYRAVNGRHFVRPVFEGSLNHE